MEGEEITELALSMNELVDAAMGTNYTQDFHLNVDVGDVAPPTVKLTDVKCHVSLLSSFLLESSLYLCC